MNKNIEELKSSNFHLPISKSIESIIHNEKHRDYFEDSRFFSYLNNFLETYIITTRKFFENGNYDKALEYAQKGKDRFSFSKLTLNKLDNLILSYHRTNYTYQ